MRESSTALPTLAEAILWARSAPHMSARAARYALVGIANGTVFAAASAIAVSLFGMSPTPASGLGYLCSVPLSFIGHRSFTFQSDNTWKGEAWRFLLVHLCSLAATVVIMKAVTALQFPYYFGILGAVLLIPFVNFLVSNFWVFATRWKGD